MHYDFIDMPSAIVMYTKCRLKIINFVIGTYLSNLPNALSPSHFKDKLHQPNYSRTVSVQSFSRLIYLVYDIILCPHNI